MEAPDLVLRSRWIAPMSSPLVEGGAVRVRGGRIVAVGRSMDVSTLDARVEDLGDSILLPGLINAHTHLELSAATPGERPASFGDWILGVIRRQVAMGEQPDETITDATLAGAAESIGFGVTTVGDISRSCEVTRRALARSPLRVVSFGEVQAMATRRSLLEPRLATAIDETFASKRLAIALSPHAPYTVEPDGYRRCARVAAERGLRLCTHLSETLEEREFLDSHDGPLRVVWEALGAWDDGVPLWPGGPIDLARVTGLLDGPTLLAHVNYASDDELDLIAAGPASVVFCPRTHAYFGHAPHRWRDMLARGINVCVGTDSRASSPDLNVVDDLRLLHRQAPEVDAFSLWEMVTTRAARALGMEDTARIEAGFVADFAAFGAGGDDPWQSVLECNARPLATWIGGTRVPVAAPGTPGAGIG